MLIVLFFPPPPLPPPSLHSAPLILNGKSYAFDNYCNIPESIAKKSHVHLHVKPNNPLAILVSEISNYFKLTQPETQYQLINNLHPVVSTKANFDDLLIPIDHVSRKPTDTYYVNPSTVLRTHTSAHQGEVLKRGGNAFLIAADVYRRDEIDTTHYPVFHQMEGIRIFSETNLFNETQISLPSSSSSTVTTTTTSSYNAVASFSENNPVQSSHTNDIARQVGTHLRWSLDGLARHLFGKDIEIRWTESYFPFTSPSWEMEILYQGKWLEVCGCGVMRQEILNRSGN